MTTRTKEQITNAIITYFENNEDIFNDCIEELDSYNCYLNDERYYEIHCLHLPACLRMIEETKMRLERGEHDDN